RGKQVALTDNSPVVLVKAWESLKIPGFFPGLCQRTFVRLLRGEREEAPPLHLRRLRREAFAAPRYGCHPSKAATLVDGSRLRLCVPHPLPRQLPPPGIAPNLLFCGTPPRLEETEEQLSSSAAKGRHLEDRHGARSQAERQGAVMTDDRFEQNVKKKVATEARLVTIAP